MRRRSLLLASLGTATSVAAARGAPMGGGPLRLGSDLALVESGFAGALQRAFSRDTGIAVHVVPGPVLPLLDALVAGELDIGLTNAPEAELPFERDGLVYGRRLIARGEFLLVGPRAPLKRGEAPAAPSADLVALLTRLHERAGVDPALPPFLSPGDGSGAALAEAAAWRRARLAPQRPWYQPVAAGASLVLETRARGAYALVERGAWLAAGGAPLGVVVGGDPACVELVHAMRSFRSPHPAGKLFVAWIGGGRGRAVVAAQRGYQAPTGRPCRSPRQVARPCPSSSARRCCSACRWRRRRCW
jgi:tungstate transport system substrate-binding protein